MDSRLTYSPEYYHTSLSAYAKDTVEYESPTRLFKYKINKNDNPTVVEELDDYFKIYVSGKPQISLITFYPRSFRTRTLFFARVYISHEDISIQIIWYKWQKVICIVWVLFVLVLGFTTSYNSGLGSFFFFLLGALFGFFTVKIGRRRYKTFIINFLNTITAD
jgi:hypothetical protein